MTTLTMQASPSGDGTTSPFPGSNMVALNSVVPVLALPNWGYGFWHWAGPVTDATNPSTTVIMTQPQSVTADFATLKLINVGIASSNFNVTFSATQGVTYRLERTPSLIQPNWQQIGNDFTAPGNNSFILTDTSGPVVPGNQFFYRVRVLP
jgi:hypothetical protein